MGLVAVILPCGALAAPTIEIVHQNPDFDTLAVDGDGIAYAKPMSGPDSSRRLYRSADEGVTWSFVHQFPNLVTAVSVTTTGVLFAHVSGPTFHLYRSGDHGLSWRRVFSFPPGYRSLTADSVTDITTSAGHFIFVGSYTAQLGRKENWIWRSSDEGRTWYVVHTTDYMRHIHFVQGDPYTGVVYAGSGDGETQSAILRSRDVGETWERVCSGYHCTAVDTAFRPDGTLVFGQDVLPPSPAAIKHLDPNSGVMSHVAPLPGPSYSALALDGTTFLVGHTHEPNLVDDGSVHLFASEDGGATFADAFSRQYSTASIYVHLRTPMAFPNGHFPIQISGAGTRVARVVSTAESAGKPTVTIGDVSPDEAAEVARFTVSLSRKPEETVRVAYRTVDASAVANGVDYEAVDGTLSFEPGAPLIQDITVPLADDERDEHDERLGLLVTAIENGGVSDGRGAATIRDDDPLPSILVDDIAVVEPIDADLDAAVEVRLTEPSGRPVLVDYTTEAVNAAPGRDYVEGGGTLTFAPGETSKLANIVLLADAVDEDSESVRVRLSNSVNAMLDDGDTSLVTISDINPPPVVQVSGDEPVSEGETATFGISLDAPSERAISVTYKANAENHTVDFAPLETTKAIQVETVDDDLDEPDGDLTLRLVDATNATILAFEDSASTTVLDNDDAPEISIGDASVDEGTGGMTTLSFRLTLSEPSGWTVVVPYTATDGSAHAPEDFGGGENPVIIAPGNEEGFIEIDVQADSLHEGDETMGVELGVVEHAEVGDGEAIGTIRNDDSPPPHPQVADTVPPFLTVVVRNPGLPRALRRGVPLRIRSSEAINLLIKLRLRARLARRLGLPRVVGTQTHALEFGETAALSPRFSRKARNKLAPLDSFRLIVRVTGTDQAGNVTVRRREILLTAPA